MAILNGRLPGSMLAYIPGTRKLIRAELVPQTAALRAAFEAEFGKALTVTDAYRDYDEQVAVKAAKGFLAATPGTSNHGWALALDLGSMVNQFGSREHNWMRANAPRYGWRHPLWARINGYKPEAWHWEASEQAVPVTNYTSVGGTLPDIPELDTPDPIEENDVDLSNPAHRHAFKVVIAETLAENLEPLLERSGELDRKSRQTLTRAASSYDSPEFKMLDEVFATLLAKNLGALAPDGHPARVTRRADMHMVLAEAGLKDIITAHVPAASDDDLTELVQLINDERDRRDRARLNTTV